MKQLTRANLRHLKALLKKSSNPAATVYDSIGAGFFLEPAPGWLNLGLWEGPGEESAAEGAAQRLVATLATELPRDAVVLDVGNGLGAQDLVIKEVARPRRLIALNITESQLRAGAQRLRVAAALPVAGDATRLPLADGSVDGVISVEAAFHFSSRSEFFAEAVRVLAPGGVLTMSDISAERIWPRSPAELFAGVFNVRMWGLSRRSLMPSGSIAAAARSAGLVDVDVRPVGERVFPPALEFFDARLRRSVNEPWHYRLGARLMLSGWRLLYRRRMLDYILLRAAAPACGAAEQTAPACGAAEQTAPACGAAEQPAPTS